MRIAAAFLSLTILAFAEDNQTTPVKRVASFTWDADTGKLSWVVQTGVEGKTGFTSSSEEHYVVSPKEAVMAFEGQEHNFTSEEAKWLTNLLHILTGYCIASTMWWYRLQGLPPDENQPDPPPSPPPAPKKTDEPGNSPVKVSQPYRNQVPPAVLPDQH